ncbi:hypothetical protein cmbei_2003280, partial [Cryptosporidium meleagridis]
SSLVFFYIRFFSQLYPRVLTIIFLFNKSIFTLCLFFLLISILCCIITLINISCIYPVYIYIF